MSQLGFEGTSWVNSNLCKRLHSSHTKKALVSLRKEMLLNLVNCFLMSHLGYEGTSWVNSNLQKRLQSLYTQKALVSLRKEMLLN